VVVVLVVLITIVVMVVVMLPGMFAMKLATAQIMPMNPFVMGTPMPSYPHPFVATVPIARTLGVIWPITHLDRDPERQGAWPDKHANRQESHYKDRKFCFHSRNKSFVCGRFLGRLIYRRSLINRQLSLKLIPKEIDLLVYA
jgi:hypothetical protein